MNTEFSGQSGDGGTSAGLVVGEVTDVDDPQQLGRVKLMYSTRSVEDQSDWAPVIAPVTGSDRGVYFPFEVGDSVLVAFPDNDIYRPYVLGGLWNGEAKPPIEDKGQQRDLRIVRSRSGHEFRLDDADGAENVEIRTGGGHQILLDDGEGTVTVRDGNGKSTVTLDSDGTVSIDAQTLDLSATSIELNATRDVKISATGNVDISGAKVNIL
jgi:uncharacterized protein involved in type VI secretion and phage assembly